MIFRGKLAAQRALQEKELREARLRDQAALRENEELYRTLVENAPEAIVVLDVDTGRFVDVNQRAERLFKFSRTELLAMGPIELSPEVQPDGQNSRESALQKIAEAASGRKPHFEWTHRASDSSLVDCEVFLVRLPSQGRTLVRGSIVDISERKQLERERALLSLAIEQAAESFLVTDTNGNILYANPACERISGYRREELLGQTPRLFKSGRHPPEFYQQLWATLLKGEVWSGLFTNRRKDGDLYEEEATISPVRDLSGRIVNFVAAKRDVTNERRLQLQLRQAQKFEAIGQLAGGIAHDFNNVIGAMLGWAQMGIEQAQPETRLREYFEKIRVQADRAAGLVRQLLAFARRQLLEPHTIDLNQTVAELLAMLGNLIGKDIELKTVLAPDLQVILADPTQVEQVLLNLCLNARDAMPRGGRLLIETRNVEIDAEYCCRYPYAKPGRYVGLVVSDTGQGMDAATLERVFEPFFTTKEPGRGTGLGLATTYGIVKQHGGIIHVYSEPSQGSVFRVYFPAVRGGVEKTKRAEPTHVVGGTETILLAEDHEGVAEMARATLEGLGYRVLLAPDGQAACELFQAHRHEVALVLLDVVMPHLSGPAAYAQMREVRPVPVIFATGYTAEAAQISDLAEGGSAILQKPYTPSQLAGRIREALDRSAAEAQTQAPASNTPMR